MQYYFPLFDRQLCLVSLKQVAQNNELRDKRQYCNWPQIIHKKRNNPNKPHRTIRMQQSPEYIFQDRYLKYMIDSVYKLLHPRIEDNTQKELRNIEYHNRNRQITFPIERKSHIISSIGYSQIDEVETPSRNRRKHLGFAVYEEKGLMDEGFSGGLVRQDGQFEQLVELHCQDVEESHREVSVERKEEQHIDSQHTPLEQRQDHSKERLAEARQGKSRWKWPNRFSYDRNQRSNERSLEINRLLPSSLMSLPPHAPHGHQLDVQSRANSLMCEAKLLAALRTASWHARSYQNTEAFFAHIMTVWALVFFELAS